MLKKFTCILKNVKFYIQGKERSAKTKFMPVLVCTESDSVQLKNQHMAHATFLVRDMRHYFIRCATSLPNLCEFF